MRSLSITNSKIAFSSQRSSENRRLFYNLSFSKENTKIKIGKTIVGNVVVTNDCPSARHQRSYVFRGTAIAKIRKSGKVLYQ